MRTTTPKKHLLKHLLSINELKCFFSQKDCTSVNVFKDAITRNSETSCHIFLKFKKTHPDTMIRSKPHICIFQINNMEKENTCS